MTFSSLLSIRSHPMRVRGLKPVNWEEFASLCRSHLMRVRGLKHTYAGCSNCCFRSHPHAGALVEVQTAIQCWEVCIGVALAVGYETTADGTQFHPPLLLGMLGMSLF